MQKKLICIFTLNVYNIIYNLFYKTLSKTYFYIKEVHIILIETLSNENIVYNIDFLYLVVYNIKIYWYKCYKKEEYINIKLHREPVASWKTGQRNIMENHLFAEILKIWI